MFDFTEFPRTGMCLLKACIFLSIHFSVSDNEDIYISLYKRLQHMDKKICIYCAEGEYSDVIYL